MISLSEIIKQSADFVNYQVDDEYDKYEIELDMKRMRNDRGFQNNVMPEILNKWGVSREKIILILNYYHDLYTIAYEFNSIDELEDKLRSGFYYLNPFIAYAIPIVKGEVKPFKIFDKNNKEIMKVEFALDYKEHYDDFRIEWN